ncbi:MAG: hypothetical protein M0Z82_16410, partial [Actinomycetota bacterium]|nr:hypothetical protein [Actinomycetota bacterium]
MVFGDVDGTVPCGPGRAGAATVSVVCPGRTLTTPSPTAVFEMGTQLGSRRAGFEGRGARGEGRGRDGNLVV